MSICLVVLHARAECRSPLIPSKRLHWPLSHLVPLSEPSVLVSPSLPNPWLHRQAISHFLLRVFPCYCTVVCSATNEFTFSVSWLSIIG